MCADRPWPIGMVRQTTDLGKALATLHTLTDQDGYVYRFTCSQGNKGTTMTINLPGLGRLYLHHTPALAYRRPSCEVLRSSCGREVVLCVGRWALYLTPSSAMKSEGFGS